MLILELGCRSSFLAPKPASQRQLLVGVLAGSRVWARGASPGCGWGWKALPMDAEARGGVNGHRAVGETGGLAAPHLRVVVRGGKSPR